MDNSETLATSGTQDTGQTQKQTKNTTQKTKKISNTWTPPKTGGKLRCKILFFSFSFFYSTQEALYHNHRRL
jgi:hypothetical protein